MCVFFLADDSDDGEEESEEGDSNSGENDGEDEEEEEEANEDDDGIYAIGHLCFQRFRHKNFLQTTNKFLSDEEEDEDAKADDGAFGRTSGDLAGISSDEDSDKCPICLNSFISQLVATPENCEHYFCLDCILEWTKVGVSLCIFLSRKYWIMFNSIIAYLSLYKNAKSFMAEESCLFLFFSLFRMQTLVL